MHHDFETQSMVDLAEVGLDNYASHSTTQALMLSWAVDDGPVQLWQAHLHGPKIPLEVGELLTDSSITKVAWNTAFERAIWRHVFGIESPSETWEDPMIQARYLSLPGKLELAAPIGGLPIDKNKVKEGRSLVKLFCEPHAKGKGKGQFNTPYTHPDEWERFCEYCVRDVEAERAFGARYMR